MLGTAEFAVKVRQTIELLRGLAQEAATIVGASPLARDEAAEFLREAAEDCDNAIRALGETP